MKDEGLHIRHYEAVDREAVRQLHDEALREVGIHFGKGSWDDPNLKNDYRVPGRGTVGYFDCVYYEKNEPIRGQRA